MIKCGFNVIIPSNYFIFHFNQKFALFLLSTEISHFLLARQRYIILSNSIKKYISIYFFNLITFFFSSLHIFAKQNKLYSTSHKKKTIALKMKFERIFVILAPDKKVNLKKNIHIFHSKTYICVWEIEKIKLKLF